MSGEGRLGSYTSFGGYIQFNQCRTSSNKVFALAIASLQYIRMSLVFFVRSAENQNDKWTIPTCFLWYFILVGKQNIGKLNKRIFTYRCVLCPSICQNFLLFVPLEHYEKKHGLVNVLTKGILTVVPFLIYRKHSPSL